ncbi:MAG: AAA family ATPase [Deltaproteobacteria bacterium]|nr:AAA family ATPase [Deltaproteobacteria bacterium]
MKQFVSRIIDLNQPLKRKSVFLLGPRQTGKTTLLKKIFPNIKMYSLLLHDQFLDFSREPGRLRRELTPKDNLVIIDEIQKPPELLDEIHGLIEERNHKFILTGSSMR